MKTRKQIWLWHLLTLFILFMLGAGLWVATKKIDYTWRWNRVPQYFVYVDEALIPAPFDARVASLQRSGGTTVVKLTGDNGEEKIPGSRQ